MSPALWRHVQTLFDTALELDQDERDAFLSRVELERPRLHAVVVSLLGAHAEIERLARITAPRNSIRH